MKHDVLYAIGEALIDFIPDKKGCEFYEITGFKPALGGAPANVCGAFSKLGGTSEMITQLGDDPFGLKIARELKEYGIGTQHISFTDKANTCLAFVSLAKDGNRTFSFYRNPSADMLFAPEQVKKEWFADAYALHYCSVSLTDTPMKKAHRAAINYAAQSGALISFDPNLRFPLWHDKNELKAVVNEFIPESDVIKISDEEVGFITGEEDIEKALPKLFRGKVKLVLFTCGSGGAWAFTKSTRAFAPASGTNVIDTTGAGDAFTGSFLYSLYADSVTADKLNELTQETLEKYLKFSNKYCGISIQNKGALPSYPNRDEMEKY